MNVGLVSCIYRSRKRYWYLLLAIGEANCRHEIDQLTLITQFI